MNDETLKEQILTEFKQVHKLAPADYTENCTNVVMSIIKEDRERALQEAISTTIRRERDRSLAEHMKSQEFYAGGKRRLKELAFPSHCSSCHSEWEDDFGDGEEPCCARAKSNIINDIMKWHINESSSREKL